MDCDRPVWAAGRTANGEIPHKSTGVAIVAPCGGGGRETTIALFA
jgi:hypothetical protein